MSENDILQHPDTDFEDSLNEISDQFQGQCSMSDLERMVSQMMNTLPKLRRSDLRDEMENMIVPLQQTPTTFDINKGLALVQGYKDRLTEIHTLAMQEYRLRKRCVEMLFDANNLISKAPSADKRKGEATMKYPVMLLQLEASETFVKEVEQILNNIKSTGEFVSRQGSILSAQISLNEYAKRSKPPSSNISNDAEDQNEYHSDVPRINMEWDEI